MTEEEQRTCMLMIISELAERLREGDVDASNTLVRQANVQFDLLFGSNDRREPASSGAVNEA